MVDKVKALAYVDMQPDALAVFDDIEQGTIAKEDVWVSAYKLGAPSVHGKVRVEPGDSGVHLESLNGVNVERVSKSNFLVSCQELNVASRPVRFPRQTLKPPYTKKSDVSPELSLNSIDYSEKSGKMVIGGPDGYCVVLSPQKPEDVVELKGHVGDVLDVKWFPSGEVVLTASSDLSLRVFSGIDGINPRTLKGHTRAVTSTHIVGVGRQVLSGSKDSSVRLWSVGQGTEDKKWIVPDGKFVDGMVVIDDAEGLSALGGADGDSIILAASPDGSLTAYSLASESGADPAFVVQPDVYSNLISIDYSPKLQAIVTGHQNGTVAIRHLKTLRAVEGSIEDTSPTLVMRNESPIYSAVFDDRDGGILIGTSSGLPCRLGLEVDGSEFKVETKEEYGGWEAVGIETWAIASDGVWCAGGEGGVMTRY